MAHGLALYAVITSLDTCETPAQTCLQVGVCWRLGPSRSVLDTGPHFHQHMPGHSCTCPLPWFADGALKCEQDYVRLHLS